MVQGTSETSSRPYVSYAYLLAAAIAVGLVHYTLANGSRGPGIFADEVGYIANARFLAGGSHIDMSQTAFYSGGWSIAMVPLSRLFAHNPARFYKAVLASQALLAVGSVVMMAQLCKWLFTSKWNIATLAAAAAGLYPAFVVNSGFAWSESMLTFSLLVVLTASVWLIRVGERGRPPTRALIVRALVAGVACAYFVTVHRRTLIAMVGLLLLVCAFLVWKRWPIAAATMFVTFAGFGYAGDRLNRHLDDVLWGGKGGIDANAKLSSLMTAHGLKAIVVTGAGQSWYQLAATGGMVAVGVLALVFLGLDRERRSTEQRVAATMIVGVFALLLAVSVAFLALGLRADHVIYGRYVDIATPLLVAVAIMWIATRPTNRALAITAATVGASTVGTWFVLEQWGKTRLAQPFNRVTTTAILGWLGGRTVTPALTRATVCTALVGLGAIGITYAARLTSLRPWIASVVVAAAVAALFAWQLGFAHSRLLAGLDRDAAQDRAAALALQATGTSEVALEPSMTVVDRLALEFWLPRVTFVTAEPKVASCSAVVSISREPRARRVVVPAGTVGVMHLFRGRRACAGLG